MKKQLSALMVAMLLAFAPTLQAQDMIQKNDIKLSSDTLTPEALWAMGRIGGYAASPDGKHIAYNVAYYSVKQNKSHHIIFVSDSNGKNKKQLTTSAKNETDVAWLNTEEIAFLRDGEVWKMNIEGENRQQLSNTKGEVEGFLFSPDNKKVVLVKRIPFHESIKENPSDLPKASGRLVTDLMYRHWDHYVEDIPHPFLADIDENFNINEGKDILEGQPYECPMEPFGGIEQLAWSPDGKQLAYTCRTKTGVEYAISTDSDIFLYDIETQQAKNLCKTETNLPKSDPTKTLKNQEINTKHKDQNVGYDTNPKFSPNGEYIAWLSMERDGYESDRNRLCIYHLETGKKKYITEAFDSNVDDFCWSNINDDLLFFIGVWHATENLYAVNFKGTVKKLTEEWADFGSLQMLNDGKHILAEKHSYIEAADLYLVKPNLKEPEKTTITQVTNENKHIFDQLAKPKIMQRWVKTTDNKQMLYWVILPPHFDENKKYPTLLFCEGGPQSPVSQFWSYRWNFMIMASQGYIVVAPNRHGLPGFGSEWCEEISGDWTGQCMSDYLTAIDDATNNLPFVDKERLAAVGASFGGFSVYYLAGHHDKRFKCFIAHDGAFNLESMYTDTEEVWFSNWEYDDAYWNKDLTENAKRTYENSPHRFVDKWDTPILCIHGEKDYRINANQGMGAFNAARLRGIPAQLLIFPDENHWVLKPQNGILWQRTYFNWLKQWIGN